MIDIKKGFKMLQVERRMNQSQVGEKLGMTPANSSRYFLRKDFRLHEDIERIADALGYDVQLTFVDRETGKRIECD